MVIPFVPGGATDIAGRILGEAMAETLGQPVVVENRGGAGGNIGGEAVARAAPDGYSLLLGTVGLLTTNPFLYRTMAFSPARDLAPVSMVYTSDLVLVVRPDVRAATLRDFVALAKSRPGGLDYGSSGTGASTHTAMELFKLIAGIDVQHVPYRGSGAALSDLLAGNIQTMMVQVPAVLSAIRAGQLRALVVTGETRNPALPEVPTMAEGGFPGAEATAWGGLLVPAGTPAPILRALNTATVAGLGKDTTKQRFANVGLDPISSSPEDMASYMASETRKWERVVREARITTD
jgi:tripartite-type tricarboxylate transporter receptor subunit TctC